MNLHNLMLYEKLPLDPAPLIDLVDRRYLQEALQVAIELDLFSMLRKARQADDLAAEQGWHVGTTLNLLRLLRFMDYLELTIDGYVCSPLAAAFLCPDSFLFYGAKFGEPTTKNSFGDTLVRTLRQETAPPNTPEPSWTHERLRQMGVHALSGFIQNALNYVTLQSAHRLLDLGGGHGFYSIAFAQKYPQLNVTLFDLPTVTELSKSFIAQFGVADRVSTMSGNFLTDPIGESYDAILCSNVLHKDKRDITLPKIHAALNPGGTFILRCRVADCPDNLETALGKLYWQVRGGRDLYTSAQWEGFVTEYGFTDFTIHGIDGIFATITARRS